uniref:Uncharacterized protein n=2 Tax=Aegilops tauschii subsp. strangulata TaxID=200361 RepID=A0A453JGL4_AEGTS
MLFRSPLDLNYCCLCDLVASAAALLSICWLITGWMYPSSLSLCPSYSSCLAPVTLMLVSLNIIPCSPAESWWTSCTYACPHCLIILLSP